jgi:outer membrane protein assembly factor BamA
MRFAIALLLVLCTAVTARAQGDDEALAAKNFDPATCAQFEDQPAAPTPAAPNMTPTGFSAWDLTGKFIDNKETARALFVPVMNKPSLTDELRNDIKRNAKAFGYHVVGIGTRDIDGKTHLIVHVEPLPIVRSVRVDPGIPWYGAVIAGTRLLHDDVRRRMRTRTGAYLPWDPTERRCVIEKEKERIIEYLHDEGYFDAKVLMRQQVSGVGITIKVKLDLGTPYRTDISRITVPNAGALKVSLDKIRAQFEHESSCVLFNLACGLFGPAPFKRAEHQADLQKVAKLFKSSGFPAVRVTSDFDPGRSIDRRTNTVRFQVNIDPRRQIDVTFEGYDENTVKHEDLQDQLTFDEASSSDDVELDNSAKAIANFLQSKGFFDARVTARRERFGLSQKESLDKIVFRIEQGSTRGVKSRQIVGYHALTYAQIDDVLGTKEGRFARSLFGGTTHTTSDILAGDVTRIVDLYRRNGYRDARVKVTASTELSGLDSAALTAALVAADKGEGLYVRFTIDEGQPTLVTQVHVELAPEDDTVTDETRPLCEQLLKDLAELYKQPSLAQPVSRDRCIGVAKDLPFREDEAAETDDRLRDRLFSRGRPRAQVAYTAKEIGPHRIAAVYRVTNTQILTVGKVVIRGNFKTRARIIRGELGLKEGTVLTSDKLAEGARRLRNTGLFDSVAISMPDLDTTGAGSVNAVVEVTERHDYRMAGAFEAGYSSFNGAFIKLIPSFPNLFGTGISLNLSGTIGANLGPALEGTLELRQLAAEGTLRFPRFIPRQLGSPIEFQTDVTAFHRQQETERFGLLRTTGATLTFSRTWERARSATLPARAITLAPYFDYRSRERNIDVLRPIGADDDDSQVPITTITGSVGVSFEWEQRVDRRGTLSPLAPEDGYRLEARLSFAHPYFLSQDTFIKAQVAGSKFFPLSTNVVLRTDLRYDQGFPLGGAALLPEVERFFAGGDGTVRGYADERLATELIETGVPPILNLRQIRVLPAGGNIMALGSVDLQYRVWSVLATGLFFDAGMIKNQWSSVTTDDIRPSVGMTLFRVVTPFGSFAFERGVPLRPRLGDDPRGRWHINFAARAQF